ncbi:MAG: energy transducer TonB [Sphingobacteriales bacterium]|nr:MAG: energy transducer TonB [Sphingobacteriales bacterium]
MNKDFQGGYLDIVFAHRNKTYGAYELRKNYDKRMLLSGLLMCSFVLLFVGWNAFKKEGSIDFDNTTNVPRRDTVIIRTVALPKAQEIPKPQETVAHAGRTAKTEHFATTKVVKDNDVDKHKIKPVSDDALAGPVNNSGLSGGKAIALDNSIHDGTDEPGSNLSKKGNTGPANPPSNNDPMTFVSEKPLFPGGETAMRKFLSDNLIYPMQARRDEVSGTVHVSFVVNTDGSIVDVKLVRGVGSGCSEEALRVVRSMPKWKAGRHNGHAVRVKMTIPVKFVLGA